jgi:hypothetical protein
MKIYFERSGGFLGRSLSTVVDTNQLPPEQALKLLEIVEDTDFFGLPENLDAGPENFSGSDQLCYRVTVEVAGVQHTVEVSDTNAPPCLQPLLDELSLWARQTRQPDGAPGPRGF